MNRILKLLGLAASKAKGDSTIKEKLSASKRMLTDILKRKYNPSFSNITLAILAIIYAISPLDFIPELALGPIGLVDDTAILFFGFKYLNKEIINYLEWEKTKKYKNVTTTLINVE